MITKPLTWAVHLSKDKAVPILSIDISPTGRLFATAGQDGVINLWSLSKALDDNSTDPYFLARLTCHDKPVNSVRFNHSGKLIASGSSDGEVIVSIFVTDSEWKPLRKWTQQELDVSEVAWGVGERSHLLASSSFDGTIIIWDVRLNQAVHFLTGHGNMIKGVAWDPFGQFFASQADTEGIFIWRTSDWKCIKKISEPFRQSIESTDHLRLSWSPDGSYLTGVQAFCAPRPYAALISRDKWNLEFCVVGHKSSMTISKWNPRFFRKESSGTSMCLCLGSTDSTFSVWLQTEKHPILHMDGLFPNRISDVAWSADGYTCIVSSWDGFVALCNFTEDELGVVVPLKDNPRKVKPIGSRAPVAQHLETWMLEHQISVNESVDKRNRQETLEEGVCKRQKKETRQEEPKPSLLPDRIPSSTSSPRKSKERGGQESGSVLSSIQHLCGMKISLDDVLQPVNITAENGSGDGAIVSCIEGKTEKWSTQLKGKVVCLTGNLNFVAVTTDNSSLHVFDEVGMRLVPAIQTPSPVYMMICDAAWHLITVTKCGELCNWDFREKRLVDRVSVRSICKEAQLESVKVGSKMTPMATLSDNRVFLYNKELQSWTLFSDPDLIPTGRQSSMFGSGSRSDEALDALSLRPKEFAHESEIEQQILNSIGSRNSKDYVKWLLAYTDFLIYRIATAGGDGKSEESKLRKICIDLIQGRSASWTNVDMVGILKNKILKRMEKVRDLERLREEIMDWLTDV